MTDDQRIARLEKSIDEIWDTVNDIKNVNSTLSQNLSIMKVTLDTIADAVTKIVDGRGTIRCVEHGLTVAQVKDDLKRCAEDKVARVSRVEGELMAFSKEVRSALKQHTSAHEAYKRDKAKVYGFMAACTAFFTFIAWLISTLHKG